MSRRESATSSSAAAVAGAVSVCSPRCTRAALRKRSRPAKVGGRPGEHASRTSLARASWSGARRRRARGWSHPVGPFTRPRWRRHRHGGGRTLRRDGVRIRDAASVVDARGSVHDRASPDAKNCTEHCECVSGRTPITLWELQVADPRRPGARAKKRLVCQGRKRRARSWRGPRICASPRDPARAPLGWLIGWRECHVP
jgi:hypothetical protein